MKKNVIKTLIIRPDSMMLLLYRGKTHPNFPGHLDFPGGELDDNESEIEAVMREIQEETSIEVRPDSLQRAFAKSYPEVDHILYIAKINDTSPNVILNWEHSNYKWFTKSELLQESIPEGPDQYYLDALGFIKQT